MKKEQFFSNQSYQFSNTAQKYIYMITFLPNIFTTDIQNHHLLSSPNTRTMSNKHIQTDQRMTYIPAGPYLPVTMTSYRP